MKNSQAQYFTPTEASEAFKAGSMIRLFKEVDGAYKLAALFNLAAIANDMGARRSDVTIGDAVKMVCPKGGNFKYGPY